MGYQAVSSEMLGGQVGILTGLVQIKPPSHILSHEPDRVCHRPMLVQKLDVAPALNPQFPDYRMTTVGEGDELVVMEDYRFGPCRHWKSWIRTGGCCQVDQMNVQLAVRFSRHERTISDSRGGRMLIVGPARPYQGWVKTSIKSPGTRPLLNTVEPS